MSAQSASGEIWAAAVDAIALSTMHPIITRMPMARAVWIIASDARTGEIAGMCAVTLRQGYVNGESATLAYLGELRIAGAARGKVTLIRAGFAALHRLVAALG